MEERIGYARVSTDSGEQLSALENQLARLRAAGLDQILQDVESGLSQTRPGYVELVRLIDSGLIKEVVVTRLDRLGRDAAATDAVLLLAARRNVAVTALDGGTVDMVSPHGRFIARIMTGQAELESLMLSLRVRRGFEQARARLRPCRGRAPWGYRISSDRERIELDPEEFPKALQFLVLLESCDWRMNTALDRASFPMPFSSCRGVKAWLLNPILRGGIGYLSTGAGQYKTVVWNQCPALLSHQKFALMEQKLAENRRRWGKNTHRPVRLLTGLCWCAGCGRRIGYAGSRTIPAVVCRARGCPLQYKSTHQAVIAEAINRSLSARAEELALAALPTEPPECGRLRSQIAQLRALADPDLEEAISAKQRRLDELQQVGGVCPELVERLRDERFWWAATQEELRLVYLQLVEKVVVARREVQEVVLRL